ncbi:twin-arginine translocase TatA/TatE family subunit [Pararhizobium mangrovi]|uniref:Sec-independent protein translocase protein TatA n=1 Tax=Pararhizobium mangrovi TaxID=2590452 RepID=A0A506U5C1_9HYPH|nr:twin-arginine translocase TatA/TatE family subunit [Pararhizobium mangrovi]TPW29572.1 twin-arginine translocase TatA/TatE family subunit [Pararhizobium mangrovi]
MGSLSIWHWLIVLVVVLLLFGRGKIPDLMGDVAKGIKSFKQGMADDDEDENAGSTEKAKTVEHRSEEKGETPEYKSARYDKAK